MTTITATDTPKSRIDWTKPWRAVHDHIRGLAPFPGAWFEIARPPDGNWTLEASGRADLSG